MGGGGVFPIYYNITRGRGVSLGTPNLYYVIYGRPLDMSKFKYIWQSFPTDLRLISRYFLEQNPSKNLNIKLVDRVRDKYLWLRELVDLIFKRFLALALFAISMISTNSRFNWRQNNRGLIELFKLKRYSMFFSSGFLYHPVCFSRQLKEIQRTKGKKKGLM